MNSSVVQSETYQMLPTNQNPHQTDDPCHQHPEKKKKPLNLSSAATTKFLNKINSNEAIIPSEAQSHPHKEGKHHLVPQVSFHKLHLQPMNHQNKYEDY